jgi:lipopolysaccharide cholinephosphotransferase
MNDKYYAFNFAKLRLNGTYVEESFSSGVSANQGIYIDIFPLDYVYDSRIRKFFQFKIFWIARNLLWVKCGYGEKCRKKTFSYKIAKFLSLFFSIDLLKKIKYRVISSCKDGEFVVTSDGTYGLKKETLKKSWISNLSKYKFENREYFGIESYDEYLTYMYKDYMQIPPVSKQNHHDRSKVDFGKY